MILDFFIVTIIENIPTKSKEFIYSNIKITFFSLIPQFANYHKLALQFVYHIFSNCNPNNSLSIKN